MRQCCASPILMGVAARTAHLRFRNRPAQSGAAAGRGLLRSACRRRRSAHERLAAATNNGTAQLTKVGDRFCSVLGLDLVPGSERRTLCRAFLDWSERRHHLAGALAAALLNCIDDRGWAKRMPNSRALRRPARFDAMMRRA
jgi:hypothetical protein